MDKKQTNLKAKKDKFKQGCISVFKKWSAFRLTLDENPKILTYYNEDQTVLEINEMLETLYEELYSICSSKKYAGKTLENELADCLAGFIEDYFQVVLADESDFEIARVLISLYNDLEDGKEVVLNNLKKNETKNLTQYSIEFPILGNQKIIFEKEDDDEDDEEEDEEEEEEEKDNHTRQNPSPKMDDGPDEDGFIEVKPKRKKGF